jgi:hypothetical protein
VARADKFPWKLKRKPISLLATFSLPPVLLPRDQKRVLAIKKKCRRQNLLRGLCLDLSYVNRDETDLQLTVRKGVAANERPPPSSAAAGRGNLWGKSEHSGYLIGPSA